MMILIKRTETTRIIVTATEKAVLNPTVFSIDFTHDMTKKSTTLSNLPDISPFPDRYNEFAIDTAVFDEFDDGFFSYMVKDQEGNVLELGKMKLESEKEPSIQYQGTPTQYKTYGQ